MTIRNIVNNMPLPVYSMDSGGDGGGDSFNDTLDEGDGLDIIDGLDDEALIEDGDSDGVDDDGEITVDAASLLSDLFKVPGDGTPKPGSRAGKQRPNAGDGNDAQDEAAAQNEVIQTQLTTQLQAGLDSMTIPDDMIPDDFNPSDPKALKNLLVKVQQNTARNAISLMFAPVQVALGQLATTLRGEIATKTSQSVNESAATRLLEANVPAAQDPGLRPMVDLIFSQAKQRFPGDMRAQVRATRKAVAAMNLKSGSKTARGKGPGDSAIKALDLYAPGATPRAKDNGNGLGNGVKLNAKQRALLALFADTK